MHTPNGTEGWIYRRLVHDARGNLIGHAKGVDLLEPSVQLAVERLGDAPDPAVRVLVFAST